MGIVPGGPGIGGVAHNETRCTSRQVESRRLLCDNRKRRGQESADRFQFRGCVLQSLDNQSACHGVFPEIFQGTSPLVNLSNDFLICFLLKLTTTYSEQLLLLRFDCTLEDMESSGTPVGIVSGTCHSYESSWQGLMKERPTMFTNIEFTTHKV